jgi:hypothetical protein
VQRQRRGFSSFGVHAESSCGAGYPRDKSVLLLWRKLRFAVWNCHENSYILFICSDQHADAEGRLQRSNRARKYQLTNDLVPEPPWPS